MALRISIQKEFRIAIHIFRHQCNLGNLGVPLEFYPHGIQLTEFNPTGFNPHGIQPTKDSTRRGFNPNGNQPTEFNPNEIQPTEFNPHGIQPTEFNPHLDLFFRQKFNPQFFHICHHLPQFLLGLSLLPLIFFH